MPLSFFGLEALSIEREVEERHAGIDHRADEHNHADGSVQHEDASVAEVLFHAVDDVGQPQPPEHGSGDDGKIAHALSKEVAGNDKRQHVEQGDEQKNDERVGKGDEKGCGEVVNQSAFAGRGGAETFSRVGSVHVDTEDEEHDAADEFQPEQILLVVNEVHHQRHAQSGDEGIEDVAQCGAGTGDDAEDSTFSNGALHTKNAHGSHRRGGDDAHEKSFDNQQEGTGKFNENIVVHKHPLAQKRHESHFVFNLLLSFTHISRWFQRTEFEWIGKCGCDERTVCSGEF